MFRQVRLKKSSPRGFTLFPADLSFPVKIAGGVLCLLLLGLFVTLLHFSNFIILYILFLLTLLSLFKPDYPLYVLALILPFFGNNPGGKYSLFFIDQLLILILLRWMIPLVVLKGRKEKKTARVSPLSAGPAPVSYTTGIWLFFFITVLSIFPLRNEIWKVYLSVGSLKWFIYSVYTAYAVYFNWCIRLTLDLFISILFFYYLVYTVREKRHLQNLALCAFSGLFTAVFLGILDFHNVIDLTFFRPLNRDIQRFGYTRLMSLFWHSGWFAEYLMILSPYFMAFLFLGRRNPIKSKKGLFYAFLALMLVYAIVFTYQRAGWISFAASTAVLFLLGRRKLSQLFFSRRNLVLFLIFIFLFGAGFTFFITSDIAGQIPLAKRMRHLFFAKDRTRIWDQALLLYRNKPLLGIGAGGYYAYHRSTFPPGHPYYFTDKVTAHSTYLHILVERGPFALLAFLLLLAAAFRRTGRTWRRLCETSRGKENDDFKQYLAGATLASLTGIAVYGLAQYLFYVRIIGLMVWFVLGLSVVIGAWSGREDGEPYPKKEHPPEKPISRRRQVLPILGFVIFLLFLLALNPTARDLFFWNECVAPGEKFLGSWFDPWDEFRISCEKEVAESRVMCLNPDISQKALRVDMLVNGQVMATKYCRDKKPHRVAALLPPGLKQPLSLRFRTDRYYRVCDAFPDLPQNRKRFHCIVAREVECRDLGLEGIGFSRWEKLASHPFNRFRWTVSPKAVCDVAVSSPVLKLQFSAHNPDLSERPLGVRVTIRDKNKDNTIYSRDITFKGDEIQGVSKTLDFPLGNYSGREVRLEIGVDRTFCPLDYGGEDSRILGVYVSEPYFYYPDSS